MLQIKDLFDPAFKDAFVQIMSEKLDIEHTRDVLRFKKEAEEEMALTRETFLKHQSELDAGNLDVKKQWEEYLSKPLALEPLAPEIALSVKKATAHELLLIDKMCAA